MVSLQVTCCLYPMFVYAIKAWLMVDNCFDAGRREVQDMETTNSVLVSVKSDGRDARVFAYAHVDAKYRIIRDQMSIARWCGRGRSRRMG